MLARESQPHSTAGHAKRATFIGHIPLLWHFSLYKDRLWDRSHIKISKALHIFERREFNDLMK